MGDMAECSNEHLIIIAIAYQEAGVLKEYDFPIKMAAFYNDKGFLTKKQREALIRNLSFLPKNAKIDEMISVYLGKLKEEKEHQRLVQSFQKPYESSTGEVKKMSKYIPCSESKINPSFSDCASQHPYDLGYVLTEWTGKPKKTYYGGTELEIVSVHYKKWCIVIKKNDYDDYTAYVCKDWETARELRCHLLESI